MGTEGNTFSVLPGTPGSIVAALLAKDNRRRLATFARRAHTFFCEATFSEADAGQARRTGHLTARACGEIATAADVQRLIPFHFSRRYEKAPEILYRELTAACSRVVLPAGARPSIS